MRYGQIVMGPAGSGKSTYCSAIVKHCEAKKRVVRVVNLDPAAEHFSYPVEADVRDLVQVDDVMEDEELKLGPNGSLIFCMEYLVQNLEWLEEQLGDEDDDYILFDCPGQIELYTHLPIMKQLVSALQQRWNFRLCGVFLLDSQFLVDPTKFFSGVLVTLSAMVGLELPQINVFSKMDLLSKSTKGEDIDKFLDPDVQTLLSEMSKSSSMSKKYHKLNKAIATLIEDYSLVQLLSLDVTEEDSIDRVLIYVDNAIQYGEDLDVKVPRLEDDIDEQDDSGI